MSVGWGRNRIPLNNAWGAAFTMWLITRGFKTPRLTDISDRYGVWTWLESFKAMGEATQTNTDSPLWIKGVRGFN
jgi:hypothetical protein